MSRHVRDAKAATGPGCAKQHRDDGGGRASTEMKQAASSLVALAVVLTAPAWCGEPHSSAEERRMRMVRDQIEARGVKDPRVLAAISEVPRHEFVPELACRRRGRPRRWSRSPRQVAQDAVPTMARPTQVVVVSLLHVRRVRQLCWA